MAHSLNFNKGKHSFFSVKEKAWHGLGTIVEECPTSEEAIILGGLNYTVAKKAIKTEDGMLIPDKYATVRTDNGVPFGIVGSRYTILQNVEAFDFFDSIVGKNEAIFQTAGALGKGETVFITAKLPGYIRVGKDDVSEKYLFLTNNHNGEGLVTAAFTPVRIVCNNTLNAALGDCSNKVKIMHNPNVVERVKEAHKIMGMANKMTEELELIFNVMAKKSIVDKDLKDLIIRTFATPDQLEKVGKQEDAGGRFESLISDVYCYAQTSDTQQMVTTKGTVFGAYNAITGYLQNVKEYKSEESRLTSIMDGSGLTTNQKAFNLCLEMVK